MARLPILQFQSGNGELTRFEPDDTKPACILWRTWAPSARKERIGPTIFGKEILGRNRFIVGPELDKVVGADPFTLPVAQRVEASGRSVWGAAYGLEAAEIGECAPRGGFDSKESISGRPQQAEAIGRARERFPRCAVGVLDGEDGTGIGSVDGEHVDNVLIMPWIVAPFQSNVGGKRVHDEKIGVDGGDLVVCPL